MDVFESHYYKINRFFLSAVGLWPYLDVKTKRIRTTFVILILTALLTIQVTKPLTSELDVDLLVEILSNFLLCISIVFVYMTIYAKERKVGEIYDQVRYDWMKIQTKEECEIFTYYAQQTNIYSLILLLVFFTSLYSLLFGMFLPVLLDVIVPLNESRYYDIPFPVEVFFDTSKYFYISFPMVCLFLHVMGFASLAVFTTLLIFIQHCNGLFNLVGHIIETAFDGNEEVSTDVDMERRIYGKLVRGVWFHERTIKCIETINSICESCYLIEIIIVGIVISVDILRILQTPLTMEYARELVTCAIHILGNFFWFYINCYFGQKVIDHSNNFHTKVCSCKWYASAPRAQKLILLVIIRTMKPCHISIGRIFTCSLEFFLTIIRTSLSYAMIFYSLRQ